MKLERGGKGSSQSLVYGGYLKVWNPKMYFKDGNDLMPIITPSYPAMNSTYNVTRSTMFFLIEEFKEALNVTKKIEEKNEDWSSLFEDYPFFSKFRAYVVIQAIVSSPLDLEDLKVWGGWIESKLRLLVNFLEKTPGYFFKKTLLFLFFSLFIHKKL